ncbi:unnamed protein product [Darwinula stevensoni]|uniref:Uncharacterized protein n=1 Tax=Darwinula stevensoni TaxID=69355 RepID=A0A7R9AGV4_9CRUS|nr:unnamed protein product [Darwinula stevensoni]CAG0904603.1 unnamed protein product [Darwinula stevensoni]
METIRTSFLESRPLISCNFAYLRRVQVEPKDQKPKDQEPKDQKPKDQEPKDQKPKDQEVKDQEVKDQEVKDQEVKDQEAEDQEAKRQTEACSLRPFGCESMTVMRYTWPCQESDGCSSNHREVFTIWPDRVDPLGEIHDATGDDSQELIESILALWTGKENEGCADATSKEFVSYRCLFRPLENKSGKPANLAGKSKEEMVCMKESMTFKGHCTSITSSAPVQ